LRCHVVDAAVYAPLTPASGFRPRLVGDRSRALRAVGTTTDPAANRHTAGRHHHPVWEPARSRRVRAVWKRERWASLFARPASADVALDVSLGAKSAGAPPGQPCTARSFRHDPRIPTPRTRCRPPRWRSLSREEPTSDVLCRLTGTNHRLQPTLRCRADAHTLRCVRLRGLTRSASAASR
jgi:hypothetical protein